MARVLAGMPPDLDRKSLIRYAQELNLDVTRFTESLDAMKHSTLIERDKRLALDLDLYTTPTFFVNGRKVVGDVPYARLKKIVEQELRRTKQ